MTRANEARRADFSEAVKQEHQQIVEAIAAGDAGSRKAAVAAIGLAAALFTTLLGAWNGRTFNRYKAPEALARALPEGHLHHELRLATHDWFQPSLVFYTRRKVQRLNKDAEVVPFLAQPLPACLAVSAQAWDFSRPLPKTRP